MKFKKEIKRNLNQKLVSDLWFWIFLSIYCFKVLLNAFFFMVYICKYVFESFCCICLIFAFFCFVMRYIHHSPTHTDETIIFISAWIVICISNVYVSVFVLGSLYLNVFFNYFKFMLPTATCVVTTLFIVYIFLLLQLLLLLLLVAKKNLLKKEQEFI